MFKTRRESIWKTILLSCAVALAVSACTTLPPAQSPAQIAAQVCPTLQGSLTTLSAIPMLDPDLSIKIQAAQMVTKGVCTVGAATVGGLAAVNSTAAPLILDVITAAQNLDAQERARLTGAVILVQTLVATAVAQATPAPVIPTTPVGVTP